MTCGPKSVRVAAKTEAPETAFAMSPSTPPPDAAMVLLEIAERIGPTMEEMGRTGESPCGSWAIPLEIWPLVKAATGWQAKPAPKPPFSMHYAGQCSDALQVKGTIDGSFLFTAHVDDGRKVLSVLLDAEKAEDMARNILRHCGEGA